MRGFVDGYMSTSSELGFVFCGMHLKNPKTGKPRDGGKYGKKSYPSNCAQSQKFLEKFFKSADTVDRDAIKFVKIELNKMLKYF